MALSTVQCQAFNDHLGSRPFPWDKKLSKDRFPRSYIYLGMYKSEKWPLFAESVRQHEIVHVARPNDPGLWPQVFKDSCLGTPCDNPTRYIGHGVSQLSYGHYAQDYQSAVFCLDKLNSVDEGIAKIAMLVEGYKDIPEIVCGSIQRQLAFRTAGTVDVGGGLYLCGVQDTYGNPAAIDVNDSMFAVSSNASTAAGVANSLFINLNATGQLTALAAAGKITSPATTANLVPFLSQLTMEWLGNQQEDLSAQGYHDREWMLSGKFSITMDGTTSRRLQVANPELKGLYKAADFAEGGAFYSYGMNAGCGDWLFKDDPEQWRFNFRSDLDGKNLDGTSLAGAVWIQQIEPYQNVNATFGIKPKYDPRWKAAPIRIYHAYHREARTLYVGDITSVNSQMKFGLARSFMGQWTWHSPEYFSAFDPNTGTTCTFNNPKRNKGYFLGEYDFGFKTVYPQIERWIMALGEATPWTRRPNTVTPATAPLSTTDYQSLVAYNTHCGDGNGDATLWGATPFAAAVENPSAIPLSEVGASNFIGYQTGIEPV